jgi:hypothetical protein
VPCDRRKVGLGKAGFKTARFVPFVCPICRESDDTRSATCALTARATERLAYADRN